MDFEFSEELTALQETCRRVARDKVKPRARQIDETDQYPEDLFEVFRDAAEYWGDRRIPFRCFYSFQ